MSNFRKTEQMRQEQLNLKVHDNIKVLQIKEVLVMILLIYM